VSDVVSERIAALGRKASLFVRIWTWFAILTVRLRSRQLPDLVRELSVQAPPARSPIPPRRLGRAVWRALSIAGYRPRCLTASLVLYRLLSENGQSADLVLGLPVEAPNNKAHAWVEIDGTDVGPPPGKAGHEELARYGTARFVMPEPTPAVSGRRSRIG
jgi:transglutaminase superfamily protein